MAPSRPDDTPLAVEFLHNFNRLTVSGSRVYCLAIIVASPWMFEPEFGSPRHTILANGLGRYKEMAT
jgi:hypothetical protein